MNRFATVLDKCPKCRGERYVQPSRTGRLCKACCNRDKSNARFIPVENWTVPCSRCGETTSTRRKHKPKSMLCLSCRIKVARIAQSRLQIEARTHKPQCEYPGCQNKVRGRKNLCHGHWAMKIRLGDPEHHRRLRQQYYAKNKEKIIAYGLAREIGKCRSIPEERAALEEFYLLLKIAEKLPCYWCGKQTKRGDRHGDHVIPLSKGGTHTLDNLCISCVSCNTRKRALMPEEFKKIVRRAA